ncbi:MAG: metalloregulator ArsR/SmtB family transcription factor [Saprospiraceae bacterium]|nr:metalloregulator ArsR/SmtB family transcription factor [Saprospiraceae bacterium]
MAYSKADVFDEVDVTLAAVAKALGHPARVAILRHLSRKPSCICGEIVNELPLSQATVSQHLKALKDVELIEGEIDGPRVCYCLNVLRCRKAMQLLQSLFSDIKCC